MTTPDEALARRPKAGRFTSWRTCSSSAGAGRSSGVAWGSMVLVVLLALAVCLRGWTSGRPRFPTRPAWCRSTTSALPVSGAPSVLGIELAPGAVTSSAEIEIGRTFARAIQIDRIQPAPSHARAGADGSLMLNFEVTEPGRPAFVEIFPP